MASLIPTNGDIYPFMYSGNRVGARLRVNAVDVDTTTQHLRHPRRRWSHNPYAGVDRTTVVACAPPTQPSSPCATAEVVLAPAVSPFAATVTPLAVVPNLRL